MLHFDELGPVVPRLPRHRWDALAQVAASSAVHVALAFAILNMVRPTAVPAGEDCSDAAVAQKPIDVQHIVFLARDPVGGGGGGGGNRQTAPIRHAEGVGSDKITLRTRKPAALTSDAVSNAEPLPSIVLDAKSLASGTFDQIGLPTGGVSYGTSTGPGSGGGVGTGTGTGIGPGTGPGMGPGSGGGTGGGVYRPGGSVTTPRVIVEVKPTYSTEAMANRIQGTVVLEMVVTRAGIPSQIRVIRSLDPGGLDQQAMKAVAQWRFEPGRLAGTPVDVLVIIMLDFSIR